MIMMGGLILKYEQCFDVEFIIVGWLLFEIVRRLHDFSFVDNFYVKLALR